MESLIQSRLFIIDIGRIAPTFMARGLACQLLTFVRGGGEPVRSVAGLKEIIHEAVTFAVRGTGVRAEIEVADDIFSIFADREQMCQVFHNLIINACQAMPGGGTVKVSAANAVDSDDISLAGLNKYVKITVADNGVGISPVYLTKCLIRISPRRAVICMAWV